ncbi:hypothetical protein [Aeromicrobium chenweiae]|uniref:hypothetical protein n=1 Tax=Aeromicrobium chenweiae TaxID=2079793 RepID=UPI00109323EF|nr:hypothetical protein [Aeromicrobium chenweiae]TGN31967.1 hypothetical protein E4L97_11360 [Aeromicrobium chenweiae]
MSEPRCGQLAGPWPPPFSEPFVAHARALLEQRPALLVVGPPGSGRNRLADEVAALGPDGPSPVRHVARHGEQGLPWFAVQQLLPGLELAADADERAVESAVREELRRLPRQQRTFVLANAYLSDPGSVTVLSRVAATGDLRLVATLTPETVVAQRQLLSVAEVVQLHALDRSTVTELLQARFGAVPHPTVVTLLLERTAGSYGVLREICDAAREAEVIVPVEDVLVLNPDRTDATTDRLASLWAPTTVERLGGGEGVTELVHLTSLLGQLDLAEARRHLDPAAIDLAIDHGTLRTADGALTFASPAEATLVCRTLPVERQRELFDRWSALLTTTLERPGVALLAAEWWRAARHLLPLPLAARAAREANLSARHRHALTFTDADHNEKGVVVAPLERAFALAELGEDEELAAMFAALDPQDLSEEELLPYLLWAGRSVPGPARTTMVDRATWAADVQDGRRRSAVNTLAGLMVQAHVEAGEELTSQLRALTFSAQLSQANRAVAFTTLSSVERRSGHPARAVESAEFALRLLLDDPDRVSAFHLDVARECHVMALISALDLRGAQEALADYSSGALGLAGSGRMTTALRALLDLVRGDVKEALVDARLCLTGLRRHDPHQVRGWVEALLALLLAQAGRHEEAHDLLEVSRTHPAAVLQRDLERRIAQACAHDALAEPEEALTLLAEVAEEGRAHQQRLAEIDACVLSVQIGGPPHLSMLLAAVDDLVEPSGTPAVWQTFARAARAYDIPALVALAEELERRDARFYAAAVAQYVLDMARRATDLEPLTRTRLQELADPVSHRHIEPT